MLVLDIGFTVELLQQNRLKVAKEFECIFDAIPVQYDSAGRLKVCVKSSLGYERPSFECSHNLTQNNNCLNLLLKILCCR